MKRTAALASKAEVDTGATDEASQLLCDEPTMTTLREHLLPRAIEQARAKRSLRIWSVGSTGERIDSIASLVHELLGDEANDWRLSFVATDVDAGTTPGAGTFHLVVDESVSIHFAPPAPEDLARRLLRSLASHGVWNRKPSDPVPDAETRRWYGVVEFVDGSRERRISFEAFASTASPTKRR